MEAAIAAQKHAPLPIAEPRRRRLILGFLKNSPGGVDHRGEFRGSKLANLPLHEVTCKTTATDPVPSASPWRTMAAVIVRHVPPVFSSIAPALMSIFAPSFVGEKINTAAFQ